VEDQGSGLLLDGLLDGERSVVRCLHDGADLVTASGDKLLGGPQAGLILGRRDLVERLARHPLARALRVDKVTLAGLEATLRHYARGEERTAIPLWQMATAPVAALRERADTMAAVIGGHGVVAAVVDTDATFGGGAAPGVTLPSVALRVEAPGHSVDELARRLRTGSPAVWARISDGRLMMDLRSVLPSQDEDLGRALRTALSA
jgi:L-seryl-tRNA(Ser) seleniumtransferase